MYSSLHIQENKSCSVSNSENTSSPDEIPSFETSLVAEVNGGLPGSWHWNAQVGVHESNFQSLDHVLMEGYAHSRSSQARKEEEKLLYLLAKNYLFILFYFLNLFFYLLLYFFQMLYLLAQLFLNRNSFFDCF